MNEVGRVQSLLEVAKDKKMVVSLWGKDARVSKVVPTQGRRRRGQKPEEVSAYTLNANKSYAIRHICYHASMLSKGIVGIFDVDKKVDIMSVTNPQERVGSCNLIVNCAQIWGTYGPCDTVKYVSVMMEDMFFTRGTVCHQLFYVGDAYILMLSRGEEAHS